MKSKSTPLRPPWIKLSSLLPIAIIILSLLAILSTFVPSTLQENIVLGFPFILWVWFLIVALLVIITVVAAWQFVSRSNDDN